MSKTAMIYTERNTSILGSAALLFTDGTSYNDPSFALDPFIVLLLTLTSTASLQVIAAYYTTSTTPESAVD
jgi:hypothetical protein